MADPYIPLVTALLAAAVGSGITLLSAHLTNRSNATRLKVEHHHQAHQRNQELLRERGEELYELTDKWLGGLVGHYISRGFVMQGKLTFDQYHDLVIRDGEKRTVNFGRIEMLIDVYFPTVRAQYDAVIRGRDELNKVDVAHKRAYERGDAEGTDFLKSYVQAQKTIEGAGDSLKKKIIEGIRAIE